MAKLPLTGSKTSGPLTLAVGLLLTGAVAAGFAGRRRLASAALHAKGMDRSEPLSVSLGHLLSGSAKASSARKTKSS